MFYCPYYDSMIYGTECPRGKLQKLCYKLINWDSCPILQEQIKLITQNNKAS